MDIKWIRKNAPKVQGKQEYIEYLETGKKLSPVKAIKAQCFSCMCSYLDGKVDCEISDCALYPFMPYRDNKEKVKRARSEKQIEHDRKLAVLRSGTHSSMKTKHDEAA